MGNAIHFCQTICPGPQPSDSIDPTIDLLQNPTPTINPNNPQDEKRKKIEQLETKLQQKTCKKNQQLKQKQAQSEKLKNLKQLQKQDQQRTRRLQIAQSQQKIQEHQKSISKLEQQIKRIKQNLQKIKDRSSPSSNAHSIPNANVIPEEVDNINKSQHSSILHTSSNTNQRIGSSNTNKKAARGINNVELTV